MIAYTYLALLLLSIAGIGLLDWRHKLALFYDRRRTLLTVALTVTIFIIWDIFGIALGIFFSAHSPYMSGIYLMAEFPIEELIFLTFLCYFTLSAYRFGEAKWPRT